MNPQGSALPRFWPLVCYAALAGGLGWGIRGQYGHQTGAMLAGAMVALVAILVLQPAAPALPAMRAVALATIGISFGGSMTYAQTIGLTHDANLIGNSAAWYWGMLGLAIKGSVWVGFCGLLFGIGLTGKPYRPRELAFLFAGLTVVHLLGMRLLNQPFDPAHKILPPLYFSADWKWTPQVTSLKPRYENWGGLLLALLTGLAYAGWKADKLSVRLGLWAMTAGAFGFPLGQCIQSYHAWHPALFQKSFFAQWDPIVNWWNFMETGFGAIWGAILAVGIWRNRDLIRLQSVSDQGRTAHWEIPLLIAYSVYLAMGEFADIAALGMIKDLALPAGIATVAALWAGRWSPYFFVIPFSIIPIAGKTLRQLCYRDHAMSIATGWIFYVIVPVLAGLGLAFYLARTARASAGRTAAITLAFLATIYTALNFAFFNYPWPWSKWTYRTPNSLVYSACLFALLWLAVSGWKPEKRHGVKDLKPGP